MLCIAESPAAGGMAADELLDFAAREMVGVIHYLCPFPLILEPSPSVPQLGRSFRPPRAKGFPTAL